MFGFIPHNIELYKLALIHKSASLVLDDGRSINNERLEFLGDAVIEAVTSDYLYIEFPDRDEGFLTQLRSKIVSRQSLNALAVELGLDRQVISSGGVAVVQKHIYGDAFEAMMGAIYLDQGYDFVNRLLINKIYFRYLNIDTLTEEETDFKSRLIEWCQKHRHKVLFRTGQERGAASNRPLFYATVLIDDMEVGHGSGESKKEAEQRAALSVAESLTDERCATLLDKFDRLEQGAAGRTARGGSATGGTATGAVATAEAATDRAAARGKSRAGSKAGADSQKGAESGAGSDAKSGTDAVDSEADSRSANAPKAAVQPEEAPNAGSAPKSRRRRRRGASAGEGAPAAEEGGSVAEAVVPVASAAVAPDAEDIAVSAEAAEPAEEPATAVAAEVAGAVTSAIEEDTVPAAEAIETTETIESRPEQTAEPASQIDMQSEEPQSEEPQSEEPQPEPAAPRAAEATETAEAASEPERTPAPECTPAPEPASSRPAAAGADSHSEKH
ncbi:MAG TPA: ribonuclease III [Alistipes sp.]|nr:ribonuclease III [Alistipes sp.]